jgi:hypothetical protein
LWTNHLCISLNHTLVHLSCHSITKTKQGPSICCSFFHHMCFTFVGCNICGKINGQWCSIKHEVDDIYLCCSSIVILFYFHGFQACMLYVVVFWHLHGWQPCMLSVLWCFCWWHPPRIIINAYLQQNENAKAKINHTLTLIIVVVLAHVYHQNVELIHGPCVWTMGWICLMFPWLPWNHYVPHFIYHVLLELSFMPMMRWLALAKC